MMKSVGSESNLAARRSLHNCGAGLTSILMGLGDRDVPARTPWRCGRRRNGTSAIRTYPAHRIAGMGHHAGTSKGLALIRRDSHRSGMVIEIKGVAAIGG